MAEQLETKSLLKTATQLGYSGPGEVNRRDAKAKAAGTPGSGSFGGFLHSFLNGGAASRSGNKLSGAKKNQNGAGASPGTWMGADKSSTASAKKPRDAAPGKKAARNERSERSEQRRAEKEEQAEDAAVAAAAEEAARLIWGLLSPDAGALDGPPDGGDAFGVLGDMRGGSGFVSGPGGALPGIGVAGVDADSMRAAMETANVSAEMNQSAVLAALDELVRDLPPGALEKALARTADEMGIATDSGFGDIAEALEMKIQDLSPGAPAASGGALLAELAVIGADRRNADGETAEYADATAETAMPEYEITGNDKRTALKESLLPPVNSADKAAGKEIRDGFPQTRQDMESNLQNRIAGNGAAPLDAANGTADALASSQDPAVPPVPGGLGAAGGAEAKPATPQTAAGGAMLDQIANLERLAEMIKAGSRKELQNLTLHLTPAELGKVTVRVESRDGVVSAFLKVEKPEAAAQLSYSLQQLRDNLKAQGIEIRELEIRQQQNEFAGGDWAGQQQRGNREAGFEHIPPERRGAGTLEDGPPEEALPAASESGGPGLNLFA